MWARRTSWQSHSRASRRAGRGFTLVELLVVLAVIAILAALLLPALGNAKARAQTAACANQLKQIAAAAQMYAGDNNGFLLPNAPSPATNGWVSGSMQLEAEAANPAGLRTGKLFPYVGQLGLYHCPADRSVDSRGNVRIRSYAMNSWLGTRAMEATSSGQRGYWTFVKEAELAVVRGAVPWWFADEHELTIDDGSFLVTMDDSRPFANFPALRHQHGFTLSFVDGHAQAWQLRDPESNLNAQKQGTFSPRNVDWLRLKQVTTVSQ